MGQGGSGEDVANAFVQGYVDLLDSVAEQPGGQAYRDLVAMSVVDGDAVANLDAAMESFSQAAVAHMPEITTQVARARADALEFVAGFPGSEGESLDLVDLGDFMRHLTDVPDDVAVARDAVVGGARPGGDPAGDRPGHPAGDRDERLPAGRTRATSTRPCSPTAPSRRAGREFVRGVRPERRLVPGRHRRGGRFVSEQAQILQADASGIKIAGQLADGSRANVTSAETYVFTGLGGQQRRSR